MKIIYSDNRYGSGDGAKINTDYDFLLFRQDWGGNESVYFNNTENDFDEIAKKVDSGEIQIDPDYSILYCKTQKDLDDIYNVGCYATLYEKKND